MVGLVSRQPAQLGQASSSPPGDHPSPSRVVIALVAVYLVWGSTYLGIRIAIESLPPLLMAGGRFALAGLLMMGFARWGQGAAWPTARQWANATVVGGCLLLVGNGGVTLAEQRLPSGLTAMLVATVPMFLVVFGWRTGVSPRPGPAVLVALVLGLAGVCLLVWPSAAVASSSSAGGGWGGSVLLVLVAAAVWAGGSLYAKRAEKPASAVLNVGMQMLAGGVLLGLASALAGEFGSFHLGAVSARSAWAFGYLVVFGSLVGFSAYVWLLGACRPALVGTYAFVNPAVAVLLGWALAGEEINRTMFLGMGAILSAVALVVLFPPRQPS